MVPWAGASAASGIPTGYAMIRDFKAQIFCRETNLSMREIDSADPVWIDRIDAFFRQTSLLPPDVRVGKSGIWLANSSHVVLRRRERDTQKAA